VKEGEKPTDVEESARLGEPTPVGEEQGGPGGQNLEEKMHRLHRRVLEEELNEDVIQHATKIPKPHRSLRSVSKRTKNRNDSDVEGGEVSWTAFLKERGTKDEGRGREDARKSGSGGGLGMRV